MSTLDELEHDEWPPADPDATYLVRRCHELRRKDVAEFTAGDLRIMLGQQIGVPFLLPRAVDILVRDPLAVGDYYPGDLLRSVARLPPSAWATCPERRADLLAAIAGLEPEDKHLEEALVAFRAAFAQGLT